MKLNLSQWYPGHDTKDKYTEIKNMSEARIAKTWAQV